MCYLYISVQVSFSKSQVVINQSHYNDDGEAWELDIRGDK